MLPVFADPHRPGDVIFKTEQTDLKQRRFAERVATAYGFSRERSLEHVCTLTESYYGVAETCLKHSRMGRLLFPSWRKERLQQESTRR